MLEFIIANIAPLIIGAVLLILVSVVLAFFIRGRASREESQDEKMKSKLPQNQRESQKEHPPQPEAQDFGLRLVLDTDEVFYLDLPTTIGRADDNTVVIDDESVSAHHARIYYDQNLGAVCIKDLDSVNGIFIDGRPTVLNILDDGARLTFGSFSLTFRDTGYLPPSNSSGEIAHG